MQPIPAMLAISSLARDDVAWATIFLSSSLSKFATSRSCTRVTSSAPSPLPAPRAAPPGPISCGRAGSCPSMAMRPVISRLWSACLARSSSSISFFHFWCRASAAACCCTCISSSPWRPLMLAPNSESRQSSIDICCSSVPTLASMVGSTASTILLAWSMILASRAGSTTSTIWSLWSCNRSWRCVTLCSSASSSRRAASRRPAGGPIMAGCAMVSGASQTVPAVSMVPRPPRPAPGCRAP
mmetsp:Transcript_39318/g.111166  ORF Transcript_39318/g.111166 Transcript_39318/m.111166 type:complete len:241 (-) Transcript_39318:339-1061(-)